MPAGKSFSARGIEICVEYFKNLGHEEIVVWLPRFRQGNRDFSDNQTILKKLQRNIKWTTARTLTSGQKISSYDDRAIVQVNLFQKHLFLHQLTHNTTKDCSLNYKFST